MTTSTFYHQPVLLSETVAALNIDAAGTYVDATFGGGGHSRAILAQLNNSGRLIVFDQDAAAWKNLPDDPRVILVRENFKYLSRFLKLHNASRVNGILADLGVSSYQFDTPERGFSTRFEGQLDMRMDQRKELDASVILHEYSEQQLQNIFERYGEVRNAKTLAATIAKGRKSATLHTISDFKALIADCIKGNPNRYLAQVFQALRIEVNDELGVLKDFLRQTPYCLLPGGRLCVITFHSIEDRIVKRFMKKGNFDNKIETDVFGQVLVPNQLKNLKDILPGKDEIHNNPRSRSARLRVAERIEITMP